MWEEFHVPDSVERTVELYPPCGCRSCRPTVGTDQWMTKGKHGYSCRSLIAGGYSCRWIYPIGNMKSSNHDGKCGVATAALIRGTSSLFRFLSRKLHHRHHSPTQENMDEQGYYCEYFQIYFRYEEDEAGKVIPVSLWVCAFGGSADLCRCLRRRGRSGGIRHR